MGIGSERHDLHSYETHDGQWIGFRQPVLRAARERLGRDGRRHARGRIPARSGRRTSSGSSCRGASIPTARSASGRYFESKERPGEKLTVDEYYGYIFENSVPGLPEQAAAEGLTPLEYMRRYGAFEIAHGRRRRSTRRRCPTSELEDVARRRARAASTRARRSPPSPNVVPVPTPEPDADGRRAVGVEVDGVVLRGFPTPSGRLEFYSRTLAEWGWPEHALPDYIAQPRPPGEPRARRRCRSSRPSGCPSRSTRAAPTRSGSTRSRTRTRCGSTRRDAARARRRDRRPRARRDRIGHFVVKAWVTEGIRPGVVACSHHMGRWKPAASAASGR